jgi:glycosyltransferase involved in cell wall biosynthesis
MAKVSIVIPIYNVKEYLERTVNSVVNQTEKDIEIILVDDGSTDGCSNLCDEYAIRDNRITVLHKENGGLSSARNAGVDVATSEYVMFLDGDDYLKENAVERLIQVMNEYPSDFIQFSYQEVSDEQKIPEHKTDDNVYQAHSSRELFGNLYKLGGVAASGCTKLFKLSLVKEVPFENIRHEDEMWCTRAFKRDLTVTYISDKLYYYVMRENSIIHSAFNMQKFDVFNIAYERIDVLRQLELNEYICNEYNRIFMTILTLYCEAKNVKNKKALKEIKKEFNINKSDIKKYAKLSKKLKLINKLLDVNYNFINLYYIYFKVKNGIN